MALHFGPLPTDHESLPTTEETRVALMSHPGEWAVTYRADRMARAETYAARVNAGKAFGTGFRAEVRKLGPECRVFVSYGG